MCRLCALILPVVFAGTVPDAWSSLARLSSFIVSNNQLSGMLQSYKWYISFMSFAKILWQNSPCLRPDRCAWAASTFTDVSTIGNSFNCAGSLPSTWYRMPSLTTVKAYNNRLTGTYSHLHMYVKLCTALAFHLTCNFIRQVDEKQVQLYDLIGHLPESWSAAPKFSSIDVSNNNLTGEPLRMPQATLHTCHSMSMSAHTMCFSC